MTLKNRLLRRPGTGWRPDEVDDRDWQFDILGVPSSALPLEANLAPSDLLLDNQWGSNSCTGYSAGYCIGIVEARDGSPYRRKAALGPYYYGRWLRGWQKTDGGATIRDVCKALGRAGMADYEHWPFAYSRVNRRPSIKCDMRGYGIRGGSYVRIFDVGTAKADATRAAIAGGYPVQAGFALDDQWKGHEGPEVLTRPTGGIWGHHALCICAYKVDPDFGLIFGGPNSWGNWRGDGWFWVTEDYLRSSYCSALTIYYGW